MTLSAMFLLSITFTRYIAHDQEMLETPTLQPRSPTTLSNYALHSPRSRSRVYGKYRECEGYKRQM